MERLRLEEDWDAIETLLPRGYKHQARITKAVSRMRGIRLVKDLLRMLMLHIASGLSLEQTCVRASEIGLGKITSGDLFKRLKKAKPWLAWICQHMINSGPASMFEGTALQGRRVLAIDASDITEPGAQGSSWRLHYAIELPSLRCAHAHFTTHKKGESLKNFPVQNGDLLLADRAYGKRGQLSWLIDQGADAIVRISPTHFPVDESTGQDIESDLPFDWLKQLRTLKDEESGQWQVRFKNEGRDYQVGVCAIRKSLEAQRAAIHAIEVEARKKNREVRPETLEYAKYVIVVTTLASDVLSASEVLETYRSRWQVELAFKRLKSLLSLGWVPKSDPDSAQSWMQGKILEALLIEKLLESTGAFSP
jgi:hypothetical protein